MAYHSEFVGQKEELTCVPSSWIKRYISGKNVSVSYPKENSLDTRKRVKARQKASPKWNRFLATVKYVTNCIDEAEIFIAANSSFVCIPRSVSYQKPSENKKKILRKQRVVPGQELPWDHPLRTVKEMKSEAEADSRDAPHCSNQVQEFIESMDEEEYEDQKNVAPTAVCPASTSKTHSGMKLEQQNPSENSNGNLKPVSQEKKFKTRKARLMENPDGTFKKSSDKKGHSSDRKVDEINNNSERVLPESNKNNVKVNEEKPDQQICHRENTKKNTAKRSKDFNVEKSSRTTSTSKISSGTQKRKLPEEKVIAELEIGDQKVSEKNTKNKHSTTTSKSKEAESKTKEETSMNKENSKEVKDTIISVSQSGPNGEVNLKMQVSLNNTLGDFQNFFINVLEATFRSDPRENQKSISKSSKGINKRRTKEKNTVAKNEKLKQNFRLLFGSSDEEDL